MTAVASTSEGPVLAATIVAAHDARRPEPGKPGRGGGEVRAPRDGSASDAPGGGAAGRARKLACGAGIFAAALAAGALYPLCLTYAAKTSLYLLVSDWSWSPAPSDGLPPLELFSAALSAGPLVLLGAAAFPAAACLSVTRPCLGRFLMGRHPSVGLPGMEAGPREELRRALEDRLSRTVVLDPPAYRGARLGGFAPGLLLFLSVLGGAS